MNSTRLSTDYFNKGHLTSFKFMDFHRRSNNFIENPIHRFAHSNDPLIVQMVNDVKQHIHEDEQRKVWHEVEDFIDMEELSIREKDRDLCILKAIATYATSRTYYGPIVCEWAHSLLDTAVIENRKLIFLARDGIAPYITCKLLKEAFPDKFNKVEIYLIYISRTVAYSSVQLDEEISSSDKHVVDYLKTVQNRDPDILRKYIVQETDLKESDRCIFVDVGFGGSIIRPVKRQLKSMLVDAQFCYLISHTTSEKVRKEKYRAHGFLAHLEQRPLDPVNKAGGNPAVHWIEDTHQGVLLSPKILFQTDSGKIVPATVTEKEGVFHVAPLKGEAKQDCKSTPELFLVKTHGLKGIVAYAKSYQLSHHAPSPWRQASDHLREIFAKYLSKLQSKERFLLIPHV